MRLAFTTLGKGDYGQRAEDKMFPARYLVSMNYKAMQRAHHQCLGSFVPHEHQQLYFQYLVTPF